jgi:peptidoglycan hydrolase CwlO-like protein
MDPQLEEVAKHIADAVGKRLAQSVEDALENFAPRIDAVVVKRLGEAETRLAERFGDSEKRLADGAKAHKEELRDLVKLTAEGYGATLERIERDLKELNTKFSDHGKALRRHTLQINALERQQAKRRSVRR